MGSDGGFSIGRMFKNLFGKAQPVSERGSVKWFDAQKGFGFIEPEDGGSDAFVHISSVQKAGMNSLVQDQRVSYELTTDQRGKTSAVNLDVA